MIIAINGVHFIKLAGRDFFFDYFLKTAASHPNHQFVFITASAIDEQLAGSRNITHNISFPRANNALLWKIWLDYTLPGIVRKYNADVLINTGGVCSLRSRVPQLLFSADLSFFNFPSFFQKKQLNYLKKNMPAFLGKAKHIIAGSDFIAKQVIQHYAIGEKKISNFPLVASDSYQPIDWQQKEVIKEKYADGKEYFLFTGEIHPRHKLINLLKAFSFFKRRQKSNLQLLIAATNYDVNDPFIESLKTYKYKKEVNLLLDVSANELVKITAAAYAFVYPSLYDGLAIFPLQAMQCGVPVIAGNTGALFDCAAEAALYVDPENFEDLAEKMMLLFKDENKRNELIKNGRSKVQKDNNDSPQALLLESILKQILPVK
ncbi:MAG: glycosyltransferase family 1 protein [Ferruginibacter sp.]